MSDWLREVENAGYSYSVQHSGHSERSLLLSGQREVQQKCIKIFWVMFLIILFFTGVIIGSYLIIEEDIDYPLTHPYILISRSGWHANESLEKFPEYPTLVSHIIITQTSTDGCDSSGDCAKLIHGIQKEHIGRNLSDIAYNFVVAGDGATYEGRGWNQQPGIGDNPEKSLVIAFLGNFDYELPPIIQVDEFKIFLRKAVKRKHVDPCFTISLHKEKPQDGGGQLLHVYNKLLAENNRRKSQLNCSK